MAPGFADWGWESSRPWGVSLRAVTAGMHDLTRAHLQPVVMAPADAAALSIQDAEAELGGWPALWRATEPSGSLTGT